MKLCKRTKLEQEIDTIKFLVFMNEKTIAIIFENLIEAVIYSITINDLIRITTPQYFAEIGRAHV